MSATCKLVMNAEDEWPSNEELRSHYIPCFAAWPDLYGIEVPLREGAPLLGDELSNWIEAHNHYLANHANGFKTAAIGFALMLKRAELEQGFCWRTEG